MRIKSLLIAIMLLCVTAVFAAPFQNVEKVLTQPNGTKLYCFASGDEFYSRLHDAEGYTIVQAENGYFVYAAADSKGSVMATTHIAGKVNPKSLGLKPNIMISQEEYQKRRKMMEVPEVRNEEGLNHGVYNNLVIFIKFKGDGEFKTTQTEIDSMFNYDGYYDISMNNYFKKATYNQLSMKSYCYPIADGDRVLAYEDIYPRNYYQPYNPTTNPEGYTDQAEREFPLLKRAVEYVADQVPADLEIDRDGDGFIDNVIFVVKGNVGDWSDLLWPHMWSMYGEEAYINGKRVGTFNFQLETSSYFSVSTLCHEMSHSLGFPDLYHYNTISDHLSPAGPWDLMCGNANPPQHSGTYMKYKYGTWIDDIPEIGYGTYTLEANSWEGGRRNCYKMPSSHPDQFYLVEYRNKGNFFEKGLPSGGLLIYRIDTRFHGCQNHNGSDKLDEVYIFRPGGSYNQNGTINAAAFSKDFDKVIFNYETDPYPFLNRNDEDVVFNISDISEIGNQMTFTYRPIETDLDPHNLKLNVNHKDRLVELSWDEVEVADSYNVYRDGVLLANVKENQYNDGYDTFSLGYHEYYVTAKRGAEESYRTNEESALTGKCSEYIIDMVSEGDYGWQGGEICVSFDNGMDDMYFTIYSGVEDSKNILVPEGTKITLSWYSGWDDSKCSFVMRNNDGVEIYASSELEEGVLAEMVAEGSEPCVAPIGLNAVDNGEYVELSWSVMVETEKFTVLRNGEVIADNVEGCEYVDDEVYASGIYKYEVKSVNADCESELSEPIVMSLMRSYCDSLLAEAAVVEKSVVISWNEASVKKMLKYDDGEYVCNIGSNSYSWGIRISAQLMKNYKDSKLSYLEMYDACKATYTYKIYNGEIVHDSVMILSGEFEANDTKEFMRIALNELPFDKSKDLWIVLKSVNASSESIPCCNYTGDANGGLVKVGNKWVPATEYNMPYTWMLRAYTTEENETPMTYNLYKNEEMLTSGLSDLTYTDNEAEGDVCYKVEAVLNGKSISQSDTLCLSIAVEPDEVKKDLIFPNPVKDYLTVIYEDVLNVKIINITGAVVFSQDTNSENFVIDMRPFESGTYILQLTTETKVITEKIIVHN